MPSSVIYCLRAVSPSFFPLASTAGAAFRLKSRGSPNTSGSTLAGTRRFLPRIPSVFARFLLSNRNRGGPKRRPLVESNIQNNLSLCDDVERLCSSAATTMIVDQEERDAKDMQFESRRSVALILRQVRQNLSHLR